MLEREEVNTLEGQADIEVCWSLTPSNLTFERDVNFTVSDVPFTASPSDYGSYPQSVGPSATNDVCAMVVIVEDREIEGMEQFSLVISSNDSAIHIDDNSMTAQVKQILRNL